MLNSVFKITIAWLQIFQIKTKLNTIFFRVDILEEKKLVKSHQIVGVLDVLRKKSEQLYAE